MNDIETALRTLPDRLDIEPRGDLITSVRRTHKRRTLRRRAVVAGVALATVGIATMPAVLARNDLPEGAAGSATASGPVTKASVDASLAALAAGPSAGDPRSSGTYAYTRSRTRHLSMSAAATEEPATKSAVPPDEVPAPPAKPSAADQPGEMFSYLYGTDREIWLDKSGSGHVIAKPLAPVFLHPGDDAIYREKARTEHALNDVLTNGDGSVDIRNPSFDSAALPTDPAAMRAYLQAVPSGVEDVNERTFTAGADLLRENVLPLNVRVAVLQALLLVPDVTVADGVKDLDGRAGVAIGRIERGTTFRQLIVGTAGTILGERDTVAVAGEFGPVGTVIGHTAVLESGFVNKLGDTVRGVTVTIDSGTGAVVSEKR